MERLTEWTGYEWIARTERLKGKIVTDRDIYNKLAEYEDIGMSPDEIKLFLKDFGISQAIEIRELKKRIKENKEIILKDFIDLISALEYPDNLFIYDGRELLWQGYVNEKQVYKYLEGKKVIGLYLGVDELIAKVD